MSKRKWSGYLVWLAVGLVFAVDAVFNRYTPPLAVAALMDESAHAITALLWLGALGLRRRQFLIAGALLGAVFIDVDHLPLELGWDFLTRGTNRPYTHSLLAIGGSVLVASLLTGPRRQVVLGAAFGLATHVIRDMATGGVPLYWPIAVHRVTIPYVVYAALLVASVPLVWRDAIGRAPLRRRTVKAEGQG